MSHSTVIRGKRSILLIALITAIVLSWPPGVAAEQTGGLQDAADIRKLTICYAHGTDAIGRGDVAAGKAIYQPCFTQDGDLLGRLSKRTRREKDRLRRLGGFCSDSLSGCRLYEYATSSRNHQH